MSTPSIAASLNPRSTAAPAPPPRSEQTAAVPGKPPVDRVAARQQLNVQILQSAAEVSLQAGDQSQNLLFRAAIDHINELLAPELGADALQGKMADDNSPEATAGRILSLSTAFYDAYAAQHADEEPQEVARNFIELIRGGFEKGFNEAKEILQGLKVFSGDIESGVMKTYELVNQGYDDFLTGKLAALGDGQAAGDKAPAA